MAASGTQPKLTEAHGPGSRGCIAWDIQGKAILTAGADSRVLIHGGGAEEPVSTKSPHQKAVTALSMTPGGHMIASASLDRTVKLHTYPGGEFDCIITRFTLPVRSLAFSITGGFLAAAGDDDEIKLISTVDNSIARVLKGHEAPVVSLSFDPKNDILASADTDGTVIYWSVGTGSKLHTIRHAAPDVDVEEAGRNEIAWHPSGDVLAVPGHQFDVVMYDRDTAEVRFWLRGGHNTAVGFLAWSPNGKYLATTGQDRKVMLWDSESKQDLDRLKVGSQVTSLSWKPTGNAIALIDVDGRYGVWEDAIPSDLPSPSDLKQALAALSRQELLHFSDDDEDGSGKENSGSGDDISEDFNHRGEEDLLDDEDSGEDEELPKVKKEFKKIKKPNKEVQLNEASQLKGSALLTRVRKERTKDNATHECQPCAHKPRPEKQASFQPGCTPQIPGARRFLSYNLLGCISSFEADGVSRVEVEFHDSSLGHRMPTMTDFNGFTMAALSEKGSIFANPQRGEKTPSTLVYRPCTSWTSNSEWSMRFPLNEEVRAVAVGDHWAAAATSLNYLRIFSETGLQKHVISLAGPVVTMTSHQELLAIIMHASDPLEGSDQVMEFVVLHVRTKERVLKGPLPLTPGAKLTWLGFSESGTLGSYDSKGVLRIFSGAYGGCWIPVFSAPAEKESGETLWVVGLDATQIYCVKCKAPETQPQVNPKPILSMVNLSMPLAHSDLGAVDLENELVRRSILVDETRARADQAAASGLDDDIYEDEVLNKEAELDRCLLRLMAAACQSDKLARALELATMLSLHKSLEGAIKIVASMHLPSLAERLNTLLEGRRNVEKLAARALESKKQLTARNSSPKLPPKNAPEVHNSSESHKEEPPINGSLGSLPSLRRSSVTKGLENAVKVSQKSTVQTLKPPQDPPKRQVTFNEPVESSSPPEPAPIVPETWPTLKPSNPFAKSSSTPAKASQNKQDGVSDGEVTLFDSLRKLQKTSVDIDPKRKTNSVVNQIQRPSKVAKAK